MDNQDFDLDQELSEYEKNTDESIRARAISSGTYFLTGTIVGLLPFAVMILVLLPSYNNSIVLNIFGLTFVAAYSVVIYLMLWNNKVITKLLKNKWIVKYLYRAHAREM